MKIAPMKKGIYSLSVLRKTLFAANKRYLDFLSSIDDITDGIKRIKKVTEKVEENHRNYRGFNLFDENDLLLLSVLMSGEFNVRGFSNSELREKIKEKNTGQISRLLKNLRVHGLIKKVANSYRYYLTKLGRHIIAAGLKIKEMFLFPELAKKFL